MWTLTPDELEKTRDKIAKINERADRRGFTGRLEVEAIQGERKKTVAGIEVAEVIFNTRITGEPPKYGDWKLLAALDWIESGVIVRTAPGVDSIDRSLLEMGKCDHCKMNRRRRKAYVVSDGTQQLQVGSSCLKDFLGHSAMPVFVYEDELDAILRENSGGGSPTYTIESALAVTWAIVTTFGFVRSGFPGATRDAVMAVLNPFSKADKELVAQIEPVAKDAIPMARKVREWILSDQFSGDGEYVQNMKALCSGDEITWEHMGLLASAPQAYARGMEKSFIKERKKEEIVNEFVGEIGDKLSLTVNVKAVRFIKKNWGESTLYTLVSDTGYTFKCFMKNDEFGVEPSDETFTITGKVKKHEEYNGMKSTMLNYVKVA